MSTARAPLAVACAALGVLLQGCLPKPPKKCAEAGFNCMDTGCCVSPGMKCYKRDDDWASCKASCTPGFSTSCEEVSTDGPRQEKRDHAATPAPTPAPTPPPTPAPTPAPTPPPAPMREEEVEWETATWTTGYWDCCKPSCSWEGKGNTTGPVASCNASTGKRADPGTKSVCDGGAAVTCANQQPFAVHANLSMGFAAAAVSGRNGLVGDENCSQCFELLFTDDRHLDEATGDLWGGASPGLQGRRMVVQVTNIGFDVTGNHSFDVLVPGAGQGIFDKGCKANYPGHETDDFDCGRRHGGCSNKTGCAKLPQELRDGCEWHFDWYRWLMHDGRTNNPYVKFRRVRCPKRLTAISGSVPTDDSNFPAVIESAEFYFIA